MGWSRGELRVDFRTVVMAGAAALGATSVIGLAGAAAAYGMPGMTDPIPSSPSSQTVETGTALNTPFPDKAPDLGAVAALAGTAGAVTIAVVADKRRRKKLDPVK